MTGPAPTTLQHARTLARRQWGSATPLRVGMVIGALYLTAGNPYPPGSRGARCFDAGVAHGRKTGPRLCGGA